MLKRIHIENYKCLRDVTVDVGDFTILIGPNDSGKSSFLEVIGSLGKIAKHGYASVFSGERSAANVVWRKDVTRYIVWEAEGTASKHTFRYHLEIPGDLRPPRESLEWDGKKLYWTEEVVADSEVHRSTHLAPGTPVVIIPSGQGKQIQQIQQGTTQLQEFFRRGQPPYVSIVDVLTSSIAYHFEMDKLPQAAVPTPKISLEPSGGNLAAVLDVVHNTPDNSTFEAIERSLREAIPTLGGIRLPPSADRPGAKALEFVLAGNGQPAVTIPGSLASGGALLLTAFLTLAYTDSPGILLFEEPENGLHPVRLQHVLDIFRKISRGEVGNRKRQVVVTTHSPLLLNYANPDDVRVFVRDSIQGTRVIPMTEVPDIDRLLKEFSLGELWYLLGEEKLFQEQPA
ncbi:MAG: AAA family ATPase [Gemmataceae bacterium]|nr:AAA family ATPase [Gemmataceae bacterium]MCI0743036.1 AAA family ATPase [Gemmataceae bacterium]